MFLIKSIKNCLNKIGSAVFIGISPVAAFASGDTPVGEGLNYFITAMTGTTGVSIAVAAVIISGLLALFHFIKWLHVGFVVIGIAIIFGAPAIVQGIVNLIH